MIAKIASHPNKPNATAKIPKRNFRAMRPRMANRPIEKIVRNLVVFREAEVLSVQSYAVSRG